MASFSKTPTEFRQIAEAVLRFTPRQQAMLASRIQKNLAVEVEATSKQVARRMAKSGVQLTEEDIAREVETVRAERYARRK